MKSNTYVAIMAGGIGSRFWPASRESMPKQFLDIMGTGKSLIRSTFDRFLNLCPPENIFIVTNAMYKDLVKEHLPEITDNQILCEPSRNNTAPCVAYTAFKLQNLNPEANFIIAPSDALISKEAAFLDKIKTALSFTENNNALCTLGISPTRPDTGYGYIKFEKEVKGSVLSPIPLPFFDTSPKIVSDENSGIKKVLEFKEKPNKSTAEEYLASGNYLWNAGIFIWKAKSVLKAFEEHANQIYQVLGTDLSKYNTSAEQAYIDENYPKTDKISVDYAIMEKATNVYTIPADIGWSDLGTWGSVFVESEKDENLNVVKADKHLLEEVSNCLVRMPKDKLLVAKGLEDFMIIDEGDVLLIYPKSKEQEIKEVTQKLKNKS